MNTMMCDVLIIGAGPAGLACAIRLGQLMKQNNASLEVYVLEKGPEVGAHILSGAILETSALDELIPDWKNESNFVHTPVKNDAFKWLTKTSSYSLPVPPSLNNNGNHIISLGSLCRYLAKKAEELGISILPGYAGKDMILDDNHHLIGVMTEEKGLTKSYEKSDRYQPGMAIHAKKVVLAEGAKGSLTLKAMKQFNLNQNSEAMTHGLGFKEVWRVDKQHHQEGLVEHTAGWPMDSKTYGGGFIYHAKDQKVYLGMIIGLDYPNSEMDLFKEFQRYKLHPKIKKLLTGGERLSYGARVVNEGGFQAIPKCEFPGGLIIGCSAGLLNIAKIKGSHNALRSGRLAAGVIFDQLNGKTIDYHQTLMNSPIAQELKKVRNIRPGFYKGQFFGITNAAFVDYISKGKEPWTFQLLQDYNYPTSHKINYPPVDDQWVFSRDSSVRLTNTNHAENQPCHLKLKDPYLQENTEKLLPLTRFCPAGVYEIITIDQKKKLQINAQNCIHCKACESPFINWELPEGGQGPRYVDM